MRRGSFFSVLVFVGLTLFGATVSDVFAASCPKLPGEPWTPFLASSWPPIPSKTQQTREVYEATGPIHTAYEPVPLQDEVVFEIPMTEDLGPEGSVSLIAETTNYSPLLRGGADPVLVSLHDGEREWVSLARSGAPGDCVAKGYFVRKRNESTRREFQPGCRITQPETALYGNLPSWWTRQGAPSGYLSVNTLPGCHGSVGAPGCELKRLPFGPKARLTARYVLMTPNYALLAPRLYSGGIRLTVVKKAAFGEELRRLDLNVYLVGKPNITASRGDQGKALLDQLLSRVDATLRLSGARITLGRLNAYEMGCAEGGDAFEMVSDEPWSWANKGSGLGDLFRRGASPRPRPIFDQALNLFLVNEVKHNEGGFVSTTFGRAGFQGGPALQGTPASGVAISTFRRLDQLNLGCTKSLGCPRRLQDPEFFRLADTIVHEIGHYLGLGHTGERDGSQPDDFDDTPSCDELVTDAKGRVHGKTIESCRTESERLALTGRSCAEVCGTEAASCPEALECEFNHIMWYTSKRYIQGVGGLDGNLFSPASVALIRRHPMVW